MPGPEENVYGWIITQAWNLMCTEFTINGFTISYGKVWLFSILCILCLRAVCFYLFTVR